MRARRQETLRNSTRRRRLPSRTGSNRRGFSIAELMFAITAVSGLSVLALTIVGLLMTAEQHSAESLWINVRISDLANDLRSDAHRATTVRYGAEEAGRVADVTLGFPEGADITYTCASDGVTRIEAADGDETSTQQYRLSFGESWFEKAQDGILRWNHTREVPSVGGYTQPDAQDTTARRIFTVNAAIGLHTDDMQEDSP